MKANHLNEYQNSPLLVKWLSVRLRNKLWWVRVLLQSLKTSNIASFSGKGSLDIESTIDCEFTIKTRM